MQNTCNLITIYKAEIDNHEINSKIIIYGNVYIQIICQFTFLVTIFTK